jgi:hypothetical protein
MSNPNFPQNLDIRPSVPLGGLESENFDFIHQQEAIRVFGIAGKVWEVDAFYYLGLFNNSRSFREAAYALNTYIKPPADLVFDPPLFPGSDSRKNVRAIELGSGTGIVAATMATELREDDVMFVTDLPEVFPFPLAKNLE